MRQAGAECKICDEIFVQHSAFKPKFPFCRDANGFSASATILPQIQPAANGWAIPTIY